MALNGKCNFTISGTLLKHSGPSPQSGACTLYDFLLGSCIGHFMIFCRANVLAFTMNLRKTQSGNTFQSTLYDLFWANVLVFTMTLRKIIKWPCPLYDVFFAECVGFYNELEKNRKVECVLKKET